MQLELSAAAHASCTWTPAHTPACTLTAVQMFALRSALLSTQACVMLANGRSKQHVEVLSRRTCGSLSFHGLSISSSKTKFKVWRAFGTVTGCCVRFASSFIVRVGLLELSLARSIRSARASSVCVINDSKAMQSAMPTAHHAAASLIAVKPTQTRSADVLVEDAAMATCNRQIKQ
jgi:hypothetical protein